MRLYRGIYSSFIDDDKSGVVELFSAMKSGIVEANKLHKAGIVEANKLLKAGFSELVKSQTAKFDINALFICLFFAYFNCKAYK